MVKYLFVALVLTTYWDNNPGIAMAETNACEPIQMFTYLEAPCQQVTACEEPGLPEAMELYQKFPDLYHLAALEFTKNGSPAQISWWLCRWFGSQMYRCLPPFGDKTFYDIGSYTAYVKERREAAVFCDEPEAEDECRWYFGHGTVLAP